MEGYKEMGMGKIFVKNSSEGKSQNKPETVIPEPKDGILSLTWPDLRCLLP